MSQRCLMFAMLVLLCQLTPVFAAEPPKTEKQRITAASGVKMAEEEGDGEAPGPAKGSEPLTFPLRKHLVR